MSNTRFLVIYMFVAFITPSLSYSQTEDSCSNLSNAMPFEIVICKTEQRKHKIENIKSVTLELQSYSKNFDGRVSNISTQIQKSDSIWNLHMETDCFLQANAAYPGESGGDGRANDQEKGFTISQCLDRFVNMRQEYLTELSKSIHDIPVRQKAIGTNKTIITPPKKKNCLKCKTAP